MHNRPRQVQTHLTPRLTRQVVAAPPPWHLAVIAGAVVRAFEHVSAQSAEYLSFLSKGQLPPANISLINFKDSLIIGEAVCHGAHQG